MTMYVMSNLLLDGIKRRVEVKCTTSGVDDTIDDTIVDELTKLKAELLLVGERWSKIVHDTSFSFYYGVRSVILVLEKIIDRFQTETKDNDLQIAKDTLEVIPSINAIIHDAMQYRTDDDLAEHILEKTDQLDEKAYDANLLKTDEEYLENVDKDTLQKLFNGMLEEMEIPKNSTHLVNVTDDKNTSRF